MCDCKNVEIGSYKAAITVKRPPHMISKIKGDMVSIDSCILKEIQYLWSLGITTYGCCCGHNKVESMVNVDDKDIDKMLELGYVQNHPDKTRKDTFKLKTT